MIGTLRASARDGCVSQVNQLEPDRRGAVLAGATIFYPSTSSLGGLGEDSSTQGGGLMRLSARGRIDGAFHGGEFAGFRAGIARLGRLG